MDYSIEKAAAGLELVLVLEPVLELVMNSATVGIQLDSSIEESKNLKKDSMPVAPGPLLQRKIIWIITTRCMPT